MLNKYGLITQAHVSETQRLHQNSAQYGNIGRSRWVLNFATLALSGRPWGVTSPFALLAVAGGPFFGNVLARGCVRSLGGKSSG
jgi:hypothetical protein